MRSNDGVGVSRLAALLVWVGLLFGYQWYAWRQDVGVLETVQHLIDAMSSGLAGPLIYVAFYALRPLILFPTSLLAVAAGFVFGPVLGLFFTVLGSNISASVLRTGLPGRGSNQRHPARLCGAASKKQLRVRADPAPDLRPV